MCVRACACVCLCIVCVFVHCMCVCALCVCMCVLVCVCVCVCTRKVATLGFKLGLSHHEQEFKLIEYWPNLCS